jgi:hypothetical protein
MTNTEHQNALGKVLEFLDRLEAAKIWYCLEHIRDSLMVVVDVPGNRYEVEFFENGEIKIERFESAGVEAADDEVLDRLIREQKDTNEHKHKAKDGRQTENLDAERIMQLLEAPTEDQHPTVHRVEDHATVSELIIALQKSQTARVREILCHILGRRHEKAAVPALTAALHDPSLSVWASAADALAKIGDIRA